MQNVHSCKSLGSRKNNDEPRGQTGDEVTLELIYGKRAFKKRNSLPINYKSL